MEQWKRTVAVWIMTAVLFCGIPRPLAVLSLIKSKTLLDGGRRRVKKYMELF